MGVEKESGAAFMSDQTRAAQVNSHLLPSSDLRSLLFS